MQTTHGKSGHANDVLQIVMNQPTERSAVRALMLTPDGEVLLMCAQEPSSGVQVWFTPGGALEQGENDAAALAREIREETGIACPEMGPLIWTRCHEFHWGERRLLQRERYYLVPCERFVPCMDNNPAVEERDSFRRFRWWSADQLDASDVLIAPRRLAPLLRDLMDNGPPASPLDAGV